MDTLLISVEEYRNLTGIDLYMEFQTGNIDDGIDYVSRFLKRVQDYIIDWTLMCGNDVETMINKYPQVKERVKKAILFQVEYVIEKGFDNTICNESFKQLKLAGFANMVNSAV